MKLLKYLNEEDINDESLLFSIKKDCEPFLKDWEKNKVFLFRGIDANFKYKKISVNKERLPADSSRDLHDFLNDVFYILYSIKLRSECIFCTASSTVAKEYGDLYFIIPVGKYKMYWCPTIEDITTYVMYLEDYIYNNKWTIERKNAFMYLYFLNKGDISSFFKYFKDETRDGSKDKKFYSNFENVNNFIDYLIDHSEHWKYEISTLYKECDLETIKNKAKKQEIMIVCDQYYALNTKNFSRNKIYEKFFVRDNI